MALNIIFMGTPKFAVPSLDSIFKSNHNILEVYTQPPKKKDRGQKINISPIHKYCIDNGIKVNHPVNLNNDNEYNNFKKLDPDLIIVAAYGKILPERILNIKKEKFINIHASLLPKWRGAAPIHRAIMNMDKETGISIMQIVPKLDSGPVLMTSKVKINQETNYEDLSQELSILGSKMILQSIELIERGQAKFVNQDESKASYAKKIDKGESKINWKESAKKIISKINALYPFPGSWFFYKGSRIKITKAKEVNKNGKAGEILSEKFIVGCNKNAVQILELQKEGKKIINVNDYLKGNTLKVGDLLE